MKEIFFLKNLINNTLFIKFINFLILDARIEKSEIKKLTVTIKVLSALATSTNTSASKQCLSIQSSKSGETSMPGESTNTTSSLSKEHLSFGQNILTS